MSEEAGSWFNTGYDHIPDPPPQRTESSNRFWLKKKDSAVVTMITDEPFSFYEHQVELGGRWDVTFTCTQGFRECPLCAAGVKRYYVGIFSIIQEGTFTYKTKDGKEKTDVNPRKLLPAKSEMLKKFKNWKDKRGTLVSARFDVTRLDDDKAERIGNDWQIKDGVGDRNEDGTARTLVQMAEIANTRLLRLYGQDDKGNLKASPHDFKTLFAPKSVEELTKVAAQLKSATTTKAPNTPVGGQADIPW